MEVVFLNVGQGDSILIITPNRNKILIDAGINEIVIRKISEHLHFFDKKIDLLITTHPDSDHIGGVPSLLKKYEFAQYGFYFGASESVSTNQIDELIKNNKINKVNLRIGDEIILDEDFGIRALVFWPDPDSGIDDKNDQSIVLKVSYNQIDFLLTGDAGIEVEERLVMAFGNNGYKNMILSQSLESEVLKLGHHGSKNSTTKEFLQMIKPNFAIISAGEDNKFGHPHQEVLDKLNYYNDNIKPITILDTKKKPVVFKTNGQDLWVE